MAIFKKVYESAHGAVGKITAYQKIAEIMVERQAAANGRQLPTRFWNVKPWDRAFRLQVNLAQGLLKLYSAGAIIRALQSEEGRRIYSLSAEWLDPLIQREEAKEKLAEQRMRAAPATEARDAGEAPRAPAPSGKSIRERLKGL
jgi:hypothetical protein